MKKIILIIVAMALALSFALPTVTAEAAVSADERAALVDLYALTNGGSWTGSSNWNSGDPCAPAWYGVTCDGGGTTITELSLPFNDLNGGIPPSIGNLTSLTYLNLFNNQLTGSIPPSIGNLTSLTYLVLPNNQLTGSIPPSIGNLTSLTDLAFPNNQLTGSIPPSIGNLTSLTYLNLLNNLLTGSIPPAIGNLTNLTTIKLNTNQLTGSIPASIGNLTGLTYLYLDTNQLTGSIPASIGNLAGLRELYLNTNQLTGSIPASIGNLTGLKYLYLNTNQLTGSIPDSIYNFGSLEILYIQSNKLSGEVPAGITNTVLQGGRNDFRYNALYSNDGGVTSFLDAAQRLDTFAATQTLAPINLTAAVVNDTSIDLSWTADTYDQAGGYELWSATTSGEPYTWLMNTVDKTIIASTITSLTPGTDYYFVLKTWTDPHANNTNKVSSDYSTEVTATTTGTAPGGGGGGCFIATAAYGSYSEAHVMALREFRDDVLLKSAAGTALVDMYYAYSPPIADLIASRPALRVATRIALAPVVGTVQHPGMAMVLMGITLAGAASIRLDRRRRRRKQ